MNNQQAYNTWAAQYDTNRNLTRDLEAVALRSVLSSLHFDTVLEAGCGTGKNSVWFTGHARSVCALDFSEEMLHLAKAKTAGTDITFRQADLTQPWPFEERRFDLVSFSLVLEHIRDLGFIFEQALQRLAPGGHIYIGELHPFRQYNGSLARFDLASGRVELQCFIHHISEFTGLARTYGLQIVALDEWFDAGEPQSPPRILSLLLRKDR